jgi:hypothetical protein
MTISLTTINPFYSARMTRRFSKPRQEQQPDEPVYARLPKAPRNASPVPHLTSLYHFHRAGEYGDRKWPGNCGGHLIRDLITYFKPASVFDPMAGSGTASDVCSELGVSCLFGDVHSGFDACNPNTFPNSERFDLIWAHPPYFRQKLYAEDSRDLSRAPTLKAFLERYGQFIRNCAGALNDGGKLIILMGDYSDREEGFVPLVYHTKRLAFEAGLRQHCTDIIRFSHGASSSKKVYRSSFIPGLHDVAMIFEPA